MLHEYNIGTDTSYINTYFDELEYNTRASIGKYIPISKSLTFSPSIGYVLNFRNETWETGDGGIYLKNNKPAYAWVRFETIRQFHHALSLSLNLEHQRKAGRKNSLGITYVRGLGIVAEGDIKDHYETFSNKTLGKFHSRGSYLAFTISRDIAVKDKSETSEMVNILTARNNVYLAVGGNLIMPTLNYEYVTSISPLSAISICTGLGFFPVPDMTVIGIPISIHYLAGAKFLSFDLSAGGALQSGLDMGTFIGHIGLGIRHQPRTSGLFARMGIELSMDSYDQILRPIPIIGLGKTW
jgi:hypothetical protein